MVFRLFVQPGEGKHWIVPKPHEPLPANATLQNSVIASTAIAAGYTSYVRNFSRRSGYTSGLSSPALFIRASARAGTWCLCAGAAINWYYHRSFAEPVVLLSGVEATPWKIWERTEKYTVDDGLLAGAGLGLATAVFLRRIPIPRWTKFMGMGYVGAFAGVATSHAWFQYRGERQPAVAALEEWHKRRNLEFYWVYWNKVFMSRLSPAAQCYVILNGVFKSNSLPEEVYESPERFGIVGIAAAPAPAPAEESNITDTPAAQAEAPMETPYEGFYRKYFDHAETLQQIDVQIMRKAMQEMEIEKKNLLKEREFIISELAKRQYEYCHDTPTSEDERERRQRQMQFLDDQFGHLGLELSRLNRRLFMWELLLQQKAAWASETTSTTPGVPNANVSRWTPTITRVDPDRHTPTLSLQQFAKNRERLLGDIANFEAREKTAVGVEGDYVRRDLEDARVLLRAIDGLVCEFEKKAKLVEGVRAAEKTEEKTGKGEAGEGTVGPKKVVEKGKDE